MSTYKEQIIKNALAIKELLDNSKSIENLDELLDNASLDDYIILSKREADGSYSTFKIKLSRLNFGAKTSTYNITHVSGEEALIPKEAIPPESGIFNIDLSNYVGIDYSSNTTNLLEFSVLEGAVLGGNARIKGIWEAPPTFNEANEALSSLFVPNVELYMYVEKWADGIIYWFDND
jgi:hypothetical protein